jgi:hypothetical protein
MAGRILLSPTISSNDLIATMPPGATSHRRVTPTAKHSATQALEGLMQSLPIFRGLCKLVLGNMAWYHLLQEIKPIKPTRIARNHL